LYMESNQLSLSLSGSRNHCKENDNEEMKICHWVLLSGEGKKAREWGKLKEKKGNLYSFDFVQ
jgi:hypothetical protein